MSEYGRGGIVNEIQAAEIREINLRAQTEHKKRCLITHRKIEDYQVTKELGITVEELNKNRRGK